MLGKALRNQCVSLTCGTILPPCDATFFMVEVGEGNEMKGPAGFLLKFMGICDISCPNQC